MHLCHKANSVKIQCYDYFEWNCLFMHHPLVIIFRVLIALEGVVVKRLLLKQSLYGDVQVDN